MSKLLLLVQSEADVAHLEAAAQAILNSAITGIWVVFSPTITVDASEVASKLGAEIEGIRAAERQAADRGDYTAAAGYKTQREGKELDKAKALRDAWKTAPDEARKKKVQNIFAPFIANLKPNGLNVKITGHSDHYEREQWVAMLNSLSGVWFKEFVPGSFAVAWPESVKDAIKPAGKIYTSEQHEEKREETKQKMAAQREVGRKEALEAMHHMSLRPIMKSLGLDPEGKGKEKMIEEIIAAEAKPIAAALAEY